MESYLNENFGEVKAKNSSEEALRRWRKLCWFVKNPKRRFRYTANLNKRSEVQAIRRNNQVSLSSPFFAASAVVAYSLLVVFLLLMVVSVDLAISP